MSTGVALTNAFSLNTQLNDVLPGTYRPASGDEACSVKSVRTTTMPSVSLSDVFRMGDASGALTASMNKLDTDVIAGV